MADWLGKTIGKVRIEKYLARGGMAEVYLGTHLTLDRPVAVKVLHGYIEENLDLLARFQREAKVVAGLRHPNIVQIYDFDTAEGHPYIVMEYLKGPTLAIYLRSLSLRNERIPLPQVAHLIKALTAALDYAHEQGVIHRDIKPGNIMLHARANEIPLEGPLPNDVEAVLTDFGLVRIVNATSQTASGMVSGTASYMAPEQARGEKTDHRTDLYSLGIVFYELLAGRVPFEADSTLSVIYMHINEPPPPIPGVSPAVQAVIDRALKKNPDERYQSSIELAADFFQAIGMDAEAETTMGAVHGGSTKQRTISSSTAATPSPAKKTTWLGAGVVALLCLFGLVVGGFLFLRNRPAINASNNTPVVVITNTAINTSLPETDTLPTAVGMVEIPADTYEVGTTGTVDEFHSASTSISLNKFWIDIYQTTNEKYQSYINETGAQTPEGWPGNSLNQPVRGVTWDQAAAYCTWANKRLPKEAEWEAAGRGPGPSPFEYPWGNDYSESSKLPVQDAYDVGTQSFNQSPFGVFDLVGNVWEWVAEPYSSVQDGYQVLRGGRFGNVQDLAYRVPTTTNDPVYINFAGFRCAADEVR